MRGVVKHPDANTLPDAVEQHLEYHHGFYFKYSARKVPCNEFIEWAKHTLDYSDDVNYRKWDSELKEYVDCRWKLYGVYAGKHNNLSKVVIYRIDEEDDVETELVHIYAFKTQDPAFYRHMSNFVQRYECKNIDLQLEKEETIVGSEITINTNEYKDPDGGVITITAGRGSINLSLQQAMQVMNEIPNAVSKYRTARRDSLADQIKELQAQIALMDTAVSTQTSPSPVHVVNCDN